MKGVVKVKTEIALGFSLSVLNTNFINGFVRMLSNNLDYLKYLKISVSVYLIVGTANLLTAATEIFRDSNPLVCHQ